MARLVALARNPGNLLVLIFAYATGISRMLRSKRQVVRVKSVEIVELTTRGNGDGHRPDTGGVNTRDLDEFAISLTVRSAIIIVPLQPAHLGFSQLLAAQRTSNILSLVRHPTPNHAEAVSEKQSVYQEGPHTMASVY